MVSSSFWSSSSNGGSGFNVVDLLVSIRLMNCSFAAIFAASSTVVSVEIPAISVRGRKNSVQHEASVSKVSAEQIFYMMQRGLSEGEAMSLAVNGFVNDLVKEFPMEYSVELKRLIELQMEGSVG